MEARLGVSRELSSMAAPAVNLVTVFCAPVAGVLAARFSLRLIMLGGDICSVAGFILLALASSYPLYLLAYGPLLGPGMAIAVVMPGMLVTRWFAARRWASSPRLS
jgi:MFS family permease